MSNNNVHSEHPYLLDDSELKVPYGDMDREERMDAFMHEVPRKKFSETAFGETVLLRNRTGKTILGVLAGAVSVFTGFDIQPIINPLTGGTEMEFLFDAGLIEIVITAVTFLVVAGVSWAGAYFKLPRKFTVKIERFLHIASEELEKAVDEESEKGRKVTKNEIYNGLITAFKKTFGDVPENLKSAK
ncbi:MAG: hypothetical protein CL666_14705 [Balneola sp.]|nr:hypothetical protein [Balneola sp.]|tara:strand:+ start:8261 stop:8821 length:561 start_codon:yes stop_codon:yes gene_type:complete